MMCVFVCMRVCVWLGLSLKQCHQAPRYTACYLPRHKGPPPRGLPTIAQHISSEQLFWCHCCDKSNLRPRLDLVCPGAALTMRRFTGHSTSPSTSCLFHPSEYTSDPLFTPLVNGSPIRTKSGPTVLMMIRVVKLAIFFPPNWICCRLLWFFFCGWPFKCDLNSLIILSL